MRKPDFSDRCPKCGGVFGKKDKYCTYCGALRASGKFEPRHNVMSMLYGPPYSAKYHCVKCNISFTSHGLGSPETRYCPNCGEKCDCTEI